MSNVDWDKVSDALRVTLEERRMSRQNLADDARVSRKTIDRLLGGAAVNLDSLRKIETALSCKLFASDEEEQRSDPDQPAVDMPDGALGTFFMARRSFDAPGRIIIAAIAIKRTEHHVTFDEYQNNVSPDGKRFVSRFSGVVNVSTTSSNLQLTTDDEGLLRVLSLSRPSIGQMSDGRLASRMCGVLMAFNAVEQFGAVYPVATPVFLESANMSFEDACLNALIGVYDQGALEVETFAAELDRAEQTHVASRGAFVGVDRRPRHAPSPAANGTADHERT